MRDGSLIFNDPSLKEATDGIPRGSGGNWLSFEMRQQSEYLVQSMAGSDLASSRSAEQGASARFVFLTLNFPLELIQLLFMHRLLLELPLVLPECCATVLVP